HGVERERPARDRVAGAGADFVAVRIEAEAAAELDLSPRALGDVDLDADDLAGVLLRRDAHRREPAEAVEVALGLRDRLRRVDLAGREREPLAHRGRQLARGAGDLDVAERAL